MSHEKQNVIISGHFKTQPYKKMKIKKINLRDREYIKIKAT